MTSAAGSHEFSADAMIAVDLGLRDVEFRNHKCVKGILNSAPRLVSRHASKLPEFDSIEAPDLPACWLLIRTVSTTSYQDTPVPFAVLEANPRRRFSLASGVKLKSLGIEKKHFIFLIQMPCITELIRLIRPFRALKVCLCRATFSTEVPKLNAPAC